MYIKTIKLCRPCDVYLYESLINVLYFKFETVQC